MKNLDTIVERVRDISEDPAFIAEHLREDLTSLKDSEMPSDSIYVCVIYAELPHRRVFIHGYLLEQHQVELWKKGGWLADDLKNFIKAWQPKTFSDLCMVFSFYTASLFKDYTITAEDKFAMAEPFPSQNPIVDSILSETKGYLLWDYQMEKLIGIFEPSGKVRREIIKDSYLRRDAFQKWASTKILDNSLSLYDVIEQRMISSPIVQPPMAIVYRLYRVLFSDELVSML